MWTVMHTCDVMRRKKGRDGKYLATQGQLLPFECETSPMGVYVWTLDPQLLVAFWEIVEFGGCKAQLTDVGHWPLF